MTAQLSPECQKIANTIDALEKVRKNLTQQMQNAAPGEKPVIKEQVQEINAQIALNKQQLQKCIKEHPYVPPEQPKPKPKPKECRALEKEIQKLRAKLNKEIKDATASLHKLLQKAAPGEKAEIIQQIQEITADIKKNSQTAKTLAEKIEAYNRCIIEHGGLPALDATLVGRVTLSTSNENAPGPFTQSVSIGFHFGDWDHSEVSVTTFSEISVTYDTPVGMNTTTVSKNGLGQGHFNPMTRNLVMPLSLFFHHSLDVAGDSTLIITLMGNVASNGNAKLDGFAPFEDGELDGDNAWLVAEGTISPPP
jgi:hypothetical protein